MRSIFCFIIIFLFNTNVFAQSVWHDTKRTYVDLSHFNLGKKIVEAPYGEAIMYFTQQDYFGEEVDADTVKILPRFFKEDTMAHLMKEGKVKIIERKNGLVVQKISHKMVQYGSMVEREFYLKDGTEFFQILEVIGLYSAPIINKSWNKKHKKTTPKKDFNEPEEFAKLNDKERIKFRDYFPIDTTMIYIYNSNDDYGDLDTIGCKEVAYEGQKIFYFPYKGYEKYNLVDIGTTMFGGGIYFYKNDSLFVVEAQNESDLKPDTDGLRFDVPHVKNASLLMPAYMAPGDSVVLIRELADNKQVYTYLTKEDVKIGKMVYNDCIKFKMLSYWDDVIYLSYIWLKKDVGMVKWIRETGRVDELANRHKH